MTTEPAGAVDAPDLGTVCRGIGELLDGSDAPRPVSVVDVASVGAQRATLLIDVGADPVERLVAQISRQVMEERSVATEASVLRLAAEAGMPVAPVIAATDDGRFAGGPVLITGRIDGVTIPRHILRAVDADPGLGPALTRDCAHALAALHRVDPDALPADVDRAGAADAAPHHIDLLTETLDGIEAPMPSFQLGLNWLRRNLPSTPTSATVVHGDFRTGNIIVDEAGLAAALDWELVHVGDPMEDLAYLCLRAWRFGNDDRMVGGFGDVDQLRDEYRSAGGHWRQDAFDWWLTARTLWWGLGLARQGQAFINGDTTAIMLAASGRRVPELEYDLLKLIAA